MEFAGQYGDKAYEICDRILQDRPNMSMFPLTCALLATLLDAALYHY